MNKKHGINITLTVIFLLLALASLFPLAYILSLSLQTEQEAIRFPPAFIPESFYLGNFTAVLDLIPIGRLFANSFIFSLSSTILVIITSLTGAYAVVKIQPPGHRFFSILFLSIVLIPPAVRTIPLYTMLSSMKLTDTWAGLTLPVAATGFGLFFIQQYLLTIPDSMLEAARIEGAGEIRILASIVTPMAAPAVSTLFLFNFLFRWNEYLWPLVMTRKKWTTLPVGVSVFKTSENLVPWNLIAAVSVITLIPVLLIYLIFRRRIVEGLAIQASK